MSALTAILKDLKRTQVSKKSLVTSDLRGDCRPERRDVFFALASKTTSYLLLCCLVNAQKEEREGDKRHQECLIGNLFQLNKIDEFVCEFNIYF